MALSNSQEIRRLAKQGKNMEAFFCATVKIWTWSFVSGSLKRKHIQRKEITLIQPTHPTFKVSVGWLANIFTRPSLMLPCQTVVQQKLPAQLETKLTKFLQ